MRLVDAPDLKTALAQAPTGPVVVNAGEGYAIFDTVEEYIEWRNERRKPKGDKP